MPRSCFAWFCPDLIFADNDGEEADINIAVSEEIDIEELARELYVSLQKNSEISFDMVPVDTNAISDDRSKTVKFAKYFISEWKRLLKETGSDMPLDAMFVTPGDLAYHAKNLERIGTLELNRGHSED